MGIVRVLFLTTLVCSQLSKAIADPFPTLDELRERVLKLVRIQGSEDPKAPTFGPKTTPEQYQSIYEQPQKNPDLPRFSTKQMDEKLRKRLFPKKGTSIPEALTAIQLSQQLEALMEDKSRLSEILEDSDASLLFFARFREFEEAFLKEVKTTDTSAEGASGPERSPSDSEAPSDGSKPNPHGESAPRERTEADPPSPVVRWWKELGSSVSPKQIQKNLDRLHSSHKADQWKGANFFVENFDAEKLNKAISAAENKSGLSESAGKLLQARLLAQKESDPRQLRESGYSEGTPTIKKSAARHEILRRLNSDPMQDLITMAPTIRPERLMELVKTAQSNDLQEASEAITHIVGTMEPDQLRELLIQAGKRKDSLFARLGLAARKTLQLQGVKISDASPEKLKAMGISKNDADSFLQAFEKEMKDKLDENNDFHEKLETAVEGSEAEKEAARNWIFEKYGREDLFDYLGELVRIGKGEGPEAEKARMEAERLAAILGSEEGGNLVLNMESRDASFEEPERRVLFLGKGAQAFPALTRFAERPLVDPEDRVSPTQTRNQFQSFSSPVDNEQHKKRSRTFQYAHKDGTLKSSPLPPDATVRAPAATNVASAGGHSAGPTEGSESHAPGIDGLDAWAHGLFNEKGCVKCHTPTSKQPLFTDEGRIKNDESAKSIVEFLSRDPAGIDRTRFPMMHNMLNNGIIHLTESDIERLKEWHRAKTEGPPVSNPAPEPTTPEPTPQKPPVPATVQQAANSVIQGKCIECHNSNFSDYLKPDQLDRLQAVIEQGWMKVPTDKLITGRMDLPEMEPDEKQALIDYIRALKEAM